jgi:hypothetical protein
VTAAAALACAAAAACTRPPVQWDERQERRLPPPAISAASGAPQAAADSVLLAAVRDLTRRAPAGAATADSSPRDPADAASTIAPPADADGRRCPASLRTAVARTAPGAAGAGGTGAAPGAGDDPHAAHVAAARAGAGAAPPNPSGAAAAVWWAARADGSAALYLSRTADAGRTWGPPLAVDTLDRSESGCDRPAPSVAIDAANGYLHVAYSMRAPEGPGVFYAHQMDPRGPFERPQVIVYGDRPAATSVASVGERVVVAYEDPNTGGRPFVSLALSRTAGHSWAERVPVSESNVAAEHPVVALRGPDEVVLGWVERAAPRELATTDDPRAAVTALPSGMVVRVGRLRD